MKAPDFTLEEVKEYLRSEVHYIEAVGVFKDAILDHIERLEAERDAAVGRLKQIRDCERCKNYPIPMQNIPCLTCTQSNNSFEWCGVTKEGTA